MDPTTRYFVSVASVRVVPQPGGGATVQTNHELMVYDGYASYQDANHAANEAIAKHMPGPDWSHSVRIRRADDRNDKEPPK